MAKLEDYLKKNKIDARRVLVASKGLERLQAEDRKIFAAKKKAKSGDDAAKEAAKELASKKPRSGHPVTAPSLNKALAGKGVSGSTKTRIVRAVNAVLTAKKKPEASFADLFGPSPKA
jgi:hypothetical protein